MLKPKFDIIVTSFNALWYLKKCIRSIQRYTKGFDYQLTVVDNGSSDGAQEYLRMTKEINSILLDKNYGPARAINKAIKETCGDFIVRIDDDSEVTPGWLEGLYQSFDGKEKIGIVGLKTVFKNGDISSAHDLAKYYGANCGGEPDRGQKDYLCYCDVVSGSGMLFRRSLIGEIGYFGEQVKYPEDIDFCLRVRMAGYKIVYNGKVSIIHHCLFRYRDEFDRQKEIFYRKWKNLQVFPLKDSHPADKYNTLGLDYLIKGDCKKALYFFKKTEALGKRFSLPFFMAVALWGMRKRKRALTKLKTLLKMNPFDRRVRYFLGLIYLKKGDYQEVFRLAKETTSAEKFANICPELSDAVYRIATSYDNYA